MKKRRINFFLILYFYALLIKVLELTFLLEKKLYCIFFSLLCRKKNKIIVNKLKKSVSFIKKYKSSKWFNIIKSCLKNIL